MPTKVTCPICHKELGDDETLVAYYYKPKKWWVINHIVRDSKSSTRFVSSEFDCEDVEPWKGWKIWCGSAGYQFSHYSDTK